MPATAKLFTSGRSQAVRLPKEYRFEGNEVSIRREGECVILEPIRKVQWPPAFWDAFTPDSEFTTPNPLPTADIDLDFSR